MYLFKLKNVLKLQNIFVQIEKCICSTRPNLSWPSNFAPLCCIHPSRANHTGFVTLSNRISSISSNQSAFALSLRRKQVFTELADENIFQALDQKIYRLTSSNTYRYRQAAHPPFQMLRLKFIFFIHIKLLLPWPGGKQIILRKCSIWVKVRKTIYGIPS